MATDETKRRFDGRADGRWRGAAFAVFAVLALVITPTVLYYQSSSRTTQASVDAPSKTTDDSDPLQEDPAGSVEAPAAPPTPRAGVLPTQPDMTPPPVDEVERLGLHVSDAELQIWRYRARFGPYRNSDDVSENSPGDWERIEDNAQRFMSGPSRGRWEGPSRNNPSGCVRHMNNNSINPSYVPPWQRATELRDAAFYALVTENRGYATAVARELVAQSEEPGVKFADRDRYCIDSIRGDHNPVFNISNWLTRLLFAYDYLNVLDADLLTAQERSQLRSWFVAAAEWMNPLVAMHLNELFVEREAGDYTLREVAWSDWQEELYQDGPIAHTLQRRYNNRSAATMRFVALAGIEFQKPELVDAGKQFVKEYLIFAFFPEGVTGEFERWSKSDPALGWKYAVELTGSLLTIADALARTGDTSLYDFETREGALGTEGTHHTGGPKSLRLVVNDLYSYTDGAFKRRTPSGKPIAPAREGWVHDTMLVIANRYYRDDYALTVYTRQNTHPYPENPNRSQGDPQGGEWGVFPGMLFQFGQLEPAAGSAE